MSLFQYRIPPVKHAATRASFGSDARNAIGRPMMPPVARPAAAAFFQSHCFLPASIQQCVNWYLCVKQGHSVNLRGCAHKRTSVQPRRVDLLGSLESKSDRTRGHLQAKKCGESTAIGHEVAPDVTRQHLAAEVVLPPVVAGGEKTPHASYYAPAHRPIGSIGPARAVLSGMT